MDGVVQESLTKYLLPVDLQGHGVRLDQDLHQDHTILMPGPDTLHEARRADGFLVDQVAELRYINASSACWRRGKREALTHDGRALKPSTVMKW